MADFKLLQQLEQTFREGPYRHRNSNLGNRIADYLYEDLYDLGESPRLRDLIDTRRRVLNPKNASPGIRTRRGDGSFGPPIPGIRLVSAAGFAVARGTTAEVEIGAEVKILAKALTEGAPPRVRVPPPDGRFGTWRARRAPRAMLRG